ncbi:MAG: LemA family protein [Gammaproteobacteria bacterium]|nr:LemA family protein [Gammaproteobacteria bacterium]MCP4090075.1 LemA family protein [Gammaproteobacteria bacterium]MCP4277035.1 LemA family protein [Gammaproteobacteria bacterium]MCP4832742.1 LemA family protein [Gammaproteobacteria bacterium]MCP4929935.1 LemA family protein [Gammaproteobacteria bacterium]
MGTTIVLVILGGLLFYGVGLYNNLVNRRNRVKNAFAQIDVQLTRRYDLIPNLVESVKGYMEHERGTLEAVINARNMALNGLQNAAADPSNAEAIKALTAAETTLTGSLGKLFALVEAYPDLKASENMLNFQEELASTENKVAFARQGFNDSVLSYNNSREVFPGNIVAGWFSFNPAEFLEIEADKKRSVPNVSFTG